MLHQSRAMLPWRNSLLTATFAASFLCLQQGNNVLPRYKQDGSTTFDNCANDKKPSTILNPKGFNDSFPGTVLALYVCSETAK